MAWKLCGSIMKDCTHVLQGRSNENDVDTGPAETNPSHGIVSELSKKKVNEQNNHCYYDINVVKKSLSKTNILKHTSENLGLYNREGKKGFEKNALSRVQ
ncbi:unnamed protein product, partial [Leptidea sinapis]